MLEYHLEIGQFPNLDKSIIVAKKGGFNYVLV
jgi:hypothetical protein